MVVIVDGHIKQTQNYQSSYLGCKAFRGTKPCPTGTWSHGTHTCVVSGNQPICSKPNPGLCPSIGGKEATNVHFTTPPTVSCSYDIDQFMNVGDIELFKQTFISPTAAVDATILPKFCGDIVSTCRSGVDQCSRMMSTASDGNMCRTWVNANPSLADVTKNNVCSAHESLDECKCIKRSIVDPVYVAIADSFAQPIADQCWYLPCRGTDLSDQLIPTDMQNRSLCPTVTCSINYNVIDSSQISLEDVESRVNCTIENAPTVPAPGGKTANGNGTGDDHDSDKSSKTIVTVVAITVVLMIVALIWLWFL